MESLDHLIVDLALIMLVAGIVALLFKKIKQPVVLGYIVAGFLISPNFVYLPTVISTDEITVWANIGIIFLMFGLGLEFNIKRITSVGKSAIITASTVIIAMMLVGFGVGQLLGWSSMTSIFLGGMISMSSTMIILKAYEDMGLKNQKFAGVVLGALVIEDIAGIFMMIILSTLSKGKGSVADLGISIGLMLAYLVIWFVLGIILIPTFLNRFARELNDEALLVISVAICLGMVVVAHFIGFSEALGAFMGGSIVGGTIHGERAEHLVKPLKDMFGAIFFVSVGMMIVPSMLIKYIGPILLLTVVTVFGQMIFSTMGILLSGQSLHTAVRGGFSMVQIGEFSFILAALGTSLGVTDDFLYPIVVCISVITTFTTPIFIRSADKVYGLLDRRLPDKAKAFLEKYGANDNEEQTKSSETGWAEYLKKFFLKTGICAVLIFMFYFIGFNILQPVVYKYLPGITGKIVLVVVICLFMIPVIVIMNTKRSNISAKLWAIDPKNRMPIIAMNTLRFLYGAAFLVATVRRGFEISLWILIPLSIIILFLLVRSDIVRAGTIKLEMQFIKNMNEKSLAKAKKERKLNDDYEWLDTRLLVRRTRVEREGDNTLIRDLTTGKNEGVLIVRIVRDNKKINLPRADRKLLEGDLLDIMGPSEKLYAYVRLLVDKGILSNVDEDAATLHKYIRNQERNSIEDEEQIICCPILCDKDSEFIHHSIKHCGFRKNYKGFIVGVERGVLSICNPDLRLVLEEGDLLWVLGDREMANALLASDYDVK